MANPADNLDSIVSILGEISSVIKRVASSCDSINTALKKYGQVKEKENKSEKEKNAGAGPVSINLDQVISALREINQSTKKVGTICDSIKQAIQNIEQGDEQQFVTKEKTRKEKPEEKNKKTEKIKVQDEEIKPKADQTGPSFDSLNSAIEKASNSIIEFGSMFSQWEDPNVEFSNAEDSSLAFSNSLDSRTNSLQSSLDGFSRSIEETSRSIIEFGSLFSQWEDDGKEIDIEVVGQLPDVGDSNKQIQHFGGIVESVGNGIEEYGSLHSQWEDNLSESMSDLGDRIEGAVGGMGGGGEGGGGGGLPGGMELPSEGAAGSFFKYIDDTDHGLLALSGNFLVAAQAVAGIGMAAYAAGKAFIGFSKMMAEIPSTFVEIVNMIGGFVKALDPAIMQQLSMAFSDLQAVAGIALRPLISAAISIVRVLADNWLPIIQKLEPIMNQLGEKIVILAGTYIGMMINVTAQFIPVIESIIPILDDLNEVFTLLVPAVVWGFDALTRVMNLLIGIYHSLMTAVKTVIVAILDMASWAVSWFSKSKAEALTKMSEKVAQSAGRSFNAAGDAFGRAFGSSVRATQGEQGGATGLAAKNASYAGIADLGKGMMQAAFGTGTKGPQERTANGIEKLGELVGDITKWVGGMAKENKKMAGVRR